VTGSKDKGRGKSPPTVALRCALPPQRGECGRRGGRQPRPPQRPPRFHSLPSPLPRTLRNHPLLTSSLILSLTPKPASPAASQFPFLIPHCSLLIPHSSTSPLARPTHKACSQLPAPHLIPHPSYFILSLTHKHTPPAVPNCSLLIAHYSFVSKPAPPDDSPAPPPSLTHKHTPPDYSPALPLSLTHKPAPRTTRQPSRLHSLTSKLPRTPHQSPVLTLSLILHTLYFFHQPAPKADTIAHS
jgi:hypothetical protein